MEESDAPARRAYDASGRRAAAEQRRAHVAEVAARLFAEIRRATGRDLPLATIFRAPTIEALAAAIRDEAGSASSGLVRLRAGDGGRPVFLVHSLSGTVMELWAALRAVPV